MAEKDGGGGGVSLLLRLVLMPPTHRELDYTDKKLISPSVDKSTWLRSKHNYLIHTDIKNSVISFDCVNIFLLLSDLAV